jgi:hypothetical protein
MSNRISQLPVEVLILSDAPVQLRVSQVAIEILAQPEATQLRLSQLAVEVLVLPFAPGTILLSQLPIEILFLEAPTFTEKTQFFIIT